MLCYGADDTLAMNARRFRTTRSGLLLVVIIFSLSVFSFAASAQQAQKRPDWGAIDKKKNVKPQTSYQREQKRQKTSRELIKTETKKAKERQRTSKEPNLKEQERLAVDAMQRRMRREAREREAIREAARRSRMP